MALNYSFLTRDTASTRLAAFQLAFELPPRRVFLQTFDPKFAMLHLEAHGGFKLPVKGAVLQLCRRGGKITFKTDSAPIKDEAKLGIISKSSTAQYSLVC